MKLWDDVPRRAPRPPEPQPSQAAVKGHILVVEDNPGVLGAMESVLRTQGYKITTATSLATAVERVRNNPDLDLVITDYHLSGSETGKQVIAAVREIQGPTFKAIVITGDTFAAVHAFDGEPFLCWLRKPVDSRQLTTILEKFLAEAG